MEIIKKDTSTEFVVIYADGTRKRVSFRPGAFDFMSQLAAPVLRSLAVGTATRTMVESIPNVVAISRADHDILHWCNQGRHQAASRLGQMDMQQAAADLLVDLAESTKGIIRSTLLDAAQMIRNLSVCEAGKDGSNGNA